MLIKGKFTLLAACSVLALGVSGCSHNTQPVGSSAESAQRPAEEVPAVQEQVPAEQPSLAPPSKNTEVPDKPNATSSKNPKKATLAPMKWGQDVDKALVQARKSGKLVMIDFYADWCGPCKMLDTKVYVNPKVVQASHDFELVKVNVDQQPAIAQKYKTNALPTLLFLNAKGETVLRQEGFESSIIENPESFTQVFEQAHVNAGASGI